jgi:plasmid stabilization system protein ParE
VSLRLVVRPEVEAELIEAGEWYEVRAAGLAAEFLRAVDACIASVLRNPLQYPVVHEQKRRALVRRFPFALIYIATEEEVVVLACMRSRRNPTRWKRRT